MSFLQLSLSLTSRKKELILFCQRCHSDPYRNRDYLSRLQTLLVFLIFNGTTKTKLAMLVLSYCGEIVENSIKNYVSNYSDRYRCRHRRHVTDGQCKSALNLLTCPSVSLAFVFLPVAPTSFRESLIIPEGVAILSEFEFLLFVKSQ